MIRLATNNDVEAISDLMEVLDTDKIIFSSAEQIKHIISLDAYYVSESDGEVVAAMAIKIEENACEIHSLASQKPGS